PLVVLVVVVAARIQAQIAADRTHVAQVHGGDLRRGLIEPGVLFMDHGVRHDFVQGQARAERGAGSVRRFFQRLDARERDQRRGRLVPALHVGKEIGPARDQHGLWPLGRKDFRRLRDARRRAEPEPGQAHHDATLSFGALRGAPIALPSPPSQGGSTFMGSGYGTSGKCSGPTRGSSPFAFFSSAASTLSGVIGSSSMRTPTAPYTAFATAGITGSSGPCPTSFAPKGQFGSGSSTSSVNTS